MKAKRINIIITGATGMVGEGVLLTPTKGLQNTHGFYKYISWLFPIGRMVYPEGFCTLKELAQAMIQLGYQGGGEKIITPTDMAKLAKVAQSQRLF